MKECRSLLQFFSKNKELRYKNGEIVIRAGDIPSGVYYIKQGFIKVYAIEENGEENLHVIYKSGELLPLVWVFSGTLKDLYYQAIGKVVLYKAPKEEFIECIKYHPECSIELITKMTSLINVHANRIENLELLKSYARIISRLLSLADRFGVKNGKKTIIGVPLTHSDIATSINMTRETASRDLEMLKKKGLIEYKNHLFVIKDLRKLKNELVKHYERKPL